jgi:hypothetical protein
MVFFKIRQQKGLHPHPLNPDLGFWNQKFEITK